MLKAVAGADVMVRFTKDPPLVFVSQGLYPVRHNEGRTVIAG
jgi:hypothetical protein